MTKKRSLLVILCIIGLSALVFSQCLGPRSGGGGSTAADPGNSDATKDGSDSTTGSKEIKASVAMEENEFELFSQMAKQYSDEHDGVNIQVENVPAGEAYERWKRASQIGEAPDLMLMDNDWVQEFAALGFLQAVGELFSSEQQNGSIGIMLDQVKWNGYIWGVPKDVDPYILAWNKQTAAQYGMDHAPESADELLAWSKAMLKEEEGNTGIYMDPTDPYAFIALSSSLAGAWLSPDRVWPDSAAAELRLGAFLAPQEEVWSGKAYPLNFPQPSAAWSPWKQLLEGRIAAMITTVSSYKLNADENIAIASIPPSSVSESNVWIKGRSFTISSRTSHAAVLMDWIKEMIAPEVEISYWDRSKMLPAQIPAYSLSPLRGDEHINSFDWLIRQGKVVPAASETPGNLQQLRSDLQKLWSGEITLRELIERTGMVDWNLKQAAAS